MSLPDDFIENLNIFTTDKYPPVGFDINAFQRFAETHGIEQAKGYLLAVKDLYGPIQEIALGEQRGSGYSTTDAKRKKKSSALYRHVTEFLELAHPVLFKQEEVLKSGAISDRNTL